MVESAPHHFPNTQSAQAQEREHHTNHDDESDQIDKSVHVSAPQRCQSCRNTNTQGREKVRRSPTPFSPELGNESERPCFVACGALAPLNSMILRLHAKVARLP